MNMLNPSIMFFFFNCTYSRYIWTLIKMKLNLTTNSNTPFDIKDEIATIKCGFSSKDQLNQLASYCLVITTYHLWDERNKHIFQQQKLNKIERAKLIQVDITYLVRRSRAKATHGARNVVILRRWGVDLNDNG